MASRFIEDIIVSVKKKLKQRQDYIRTKRLIISNLTIKEAEAIYTTYIDKKLTRTIRDTEDSFKEKERSLTISEIKGAIRRKLENEQIFNIVPRLREVAK